MTVSHKSITGDQLHEPKGVENANNGDVYVADGAGSGAWADLAATITPTSLFYLNGKIDDISTANDNTMFVVPVAATLDTVDTVIDGAFTVDNAIISFYKNGVLQGQTLIIATAGSASGITDSVDLSLSVAEGDTIEMRTNGGSTDATSLYATLSFTGT